MAEIIRRVEPEDEDVEVIDSNDLSSVDKVDVTQALAESADIHDLNFEAARSEAGTATGKYLVALADGRLTTTTLRITRSKPK